MNARLEQITGNSWEDLKKNANDIALSVLGTQKKKHQDRFDSNDEEINKLIEERRKCMKTFQQSTSNKENLCLKLRNLKRIKKLLENDWWKTKADELEIASNKRNTKEMYNLTKDMFGPKKPKRSPLRSADSTTLVTDKKDIHNCMSEHFSQPLNRESDVNFNVIDSIQQYYTLYHLDASPSFEEVGTAIEELSSGKCPGLDNIPPEVYKHGGVTLKRELTHLIQEK